MVIALTGRGHEMPDLIAAIVRPLSCSCWPLDRPEACNFSVIELAQHGPTSVQPHEHPVLKEEVKTAKEKLVHSAGFDSWGQF